MSTLSGPFAPVVTPFTDDSSGISEVRLARLVRRLVDSGARGFFVGTEAGEFTCLSFSERKSALEIVVRECHGALPVVAHISTLSTASSLDLAQHAQRHGARAALVMPPYYGQYTDLEIEWHFRTIHQYADIPLIVIDPLKRISGAIAKNLQGMDRLTLIERPSRTDMIQGDGFDVKASHAFPADLGKDDAAKFDELAMYHGSAKVLKAALEEINLDCGPVRKPLQFLDREFAAEVTTIARHALG